MNWPAYGFGLVIGSRTDKHSIHTTHHINLLQYVKLQDDHKHSTPYTGMLYWWKLTYIFFSEVWQVPSRTPSVHVITLRHDKCPVYCTKTVWRLANSYRMFGFLSIILCINWIHLSVPKGCFLQGCFLTFFFLKKMLPRFRRLPGSCSYATLCTKKPTISLKFSALLRSIL